MNGKSHLVNVSKAAVSVSFEQFVFMTWNRPLGKQQTLPLITATEAGRGGNKWWWGGGVGLSRRGMKHVSGTDAVHDWCTSAHASITSATTRRRREIKTYDGGSGASELAQIPPQELQWKKKSCNKITSKKWKTSIYWLRCSDTNFRLHMKQSLCIPTRGNC